MIAPNIVKGDQIGKVLERALEAGGGLLRLTPTWVPRSFLHPGKRIKLHPEDYYAYGAHRGGIDERWFASTTDAANEGRVWHEGQSFCSYDGQQFLLKEAVAEAGPRVIGKALWDKYQRWPVYSKFFDNMGPIPHHMHQKFEHARLTGQEGKPEAYYFAPQYNNCDNAFPYTFMGLEPGTTKVQLAQVPAGLVERRQRHPGLVAGLPAEARHGVVDSARRAACSRLAVHLRTAVGQRRVRHVPVARRRA